MRESGELIATEYKHARARWKNFESSLKGVGRDGMSVGAPLSHCSELPLAAVRALMLRQPRRRAGRAEAMSRNEKLRNEKNS